MADSVANVPAAKKIAVYTAVFGKKDRLLEPAVKPASCDFICFTDQPFRSRTWKVVRVARPLPDPTRSARRYKVLAHEYLPDYEVSIWVDGNVQVRGDIAALADEHLARFDMAVPDHARSGQIPLRSVKDGLDRLLMMERIGKRQDDPVLMNEQYVAYKKDGFPDTGGLLWSLVLFRRHKSEAVIRTMEAWWKEIERWSRRDQMSFNYAAWKMGLSFTYLPFDPADNPYFKRLSHYLPWHRRLYSYWLGALRRISDFL